MTGSGRSTTPPTPVPDTPPHVVVEIWDEKAGFDRFIENRLTPAATAVGMDRETTITVEPLHNLFAPRLEELPALENFFAPVEVKIRNRRANHALVRERLVTTKLALTDVCLQRRHGGIASVWGHDDLRQLARNPGAFGAPGGVRVIRKCHDRALDALGVDDGDLTALVRRAPSRNGDSSAGEGRHRASVGNGIDEA